MSEEELEKENAELKEKLNFSTQYFQGEKAKEQLTKAKSLINRLYDYIVLSEDYWKAEDVEKQKEILKEAEQFLKEE